MHWDQIEGNWRLLKSSMRVRSGKLTDDDRRLIEGDRDRAIGRLQEAYGKACEQAEKDLDDWYRSL
ncbi:MAG: CsbD family protein [Alphaproteobacteria bacterium]